MNFSLTFSASSSDLDKDQGSYTLKCWGCVSTCTWAISYNSNSSSAGIASLGLRVWPAVNRETPFIWLTEEISRQSRMKCSTVLYISMIQVWMSFNLGTKIYTIYAEQAPLISGVRWNGYDKKNGPLRRGMQTTACQVLESSVCLFPHLERSSMSILDAPLSGWPTSVRTLSNRGVAVDRLK